MLCYSCVAQPGRLADGHVRSLETEAHQRREADGAAEGDEVREERQHAGQGRDDDHIDQRDDEADDDVVLRHRALVEAHEADLDELERWPGVNLQSA